MRQLLNEVLTMALSRGNKRNQHYIDMDGYHCFYEKIGRRQK